MLKLNLPAGGQKSKQKGQVILILILVMTVALAIGLSIVQKSLVDVSTSSKVEQSSRAFSAAEAGIETALRSSTSASCAAGSGNCKDFSGSRIQEIADVDKIPCIPGEVTCAQAANVQQAPLDFPPLYKEDVMQAWLVDPQINLPACGATDICYQQASMDVFWGNSATDKAALELTLVYYDGTKFRSKKWFLDSDSSRTTNNGFEDVSSSCGGGHTPPGGTITYQCQHTLTGMPVPSTLGQVMLVRPRLHYNQNPQPVAFQAIGTTNPPTNRILPPQARSISSKGTSGETQRKLNLFQTYKMVPPYFDYAIFSIGEIVK